MKPIELTQEHKSKLLEMCRALFPEYKWGFGDFYTSEVGAKYNGLDYLDITHVNHKIPCIKSRFEIEAEDTTNLKIVKKHENYPDYDKVEYGFIDNFGEHAFFTNNNEKIQQGRDYEETYVEGIHWFEFCMTHLCQKVFIHDESLNDYLLTFNTEKHPVDYLYEEFKNLHK